MDKILIIIGVVLAVIVIGYFALSVFNKRRMGKLFMQIQITANQVPKQKKKSFVLLMLMETLSASKKKSKTNPNRLNNQKYVDIQMIKMSKILNQKTPQKDKRTKHALNLLNSYQRWEEQARTGTKVKKVKKVKK